MTEGDEPFAATHTAAEIGMPTWPHPGSTAVGPRLDPCLPVQLVRVYGDWAQVVCSNGWSAWVDGRGLAPIARQARPASGAAPPSANGAGSGRHAFTTPTWATWPLSAGAALVVLGAFLPWIDFGGGAEAVNGLDVPLAFLLGKDKLLDGGPGLGVALLVLAVAAFVLGHIAGRERLSKLPAALCVPLTVMFVVQLNALLAAIDDAGATAAPSLLEVVGIGVWLALIGAALMTWGAKQMRQRG